MKKAKRVVLFGIDGAGTFFAKAQTPNMDRIFAGGAVSRRTMTEIPTISAECWGGMLHGVECGWHGLTNSVVGQTPYPADSKYPSVFRVIREAMPKAKLAAFCDWNPINIGIIENGLDVYKFSDRDEKMVEPAIGYIRENDFTFLFFQFDSVDGAGHRHGYGSPEHLEAIRRNDGYIGSVVAAIEERGWLEDTLILVEADHGGTPNHGFGGHHGGVTEEELYVSFFAAGPGVARGEVTDMLVRDTPAIVLHALGIPQPETWTARVPEGLFADFRPAPRPAGMPPEGWDRELAPLEEKGEFLKEFADLEPCLYLSFESDGEFPEGTVTHGKLYRQEGRVGQGMGFADGSLELDCRQMEKGYSVLFWVKADRSLRSAPAVAVAAGASCRQAGREPGFRLELGENYVRALVCGQLRERPCQLDMTCPGELTGKWNHVAFAVDPEAGHLCLRLNFGRTYYWGFPKDMAMFSSGKLYIGRDGDCDPGDRLPAVVDDLCVCRKPLDDEAVRRLRDYYRA